MQGTLIIRVHGDIEPFNFFVSSVEHLSDTVVDVRALPTGASNVVDGQVGCACA